MHARADESASSRGSGQFLAGKCRICRMPFVAYVELDTRSDGQMEGEHA
jgi:hypothetical protein